MFRDLKTLLLLSRFATRYPACAQQSLSYLSPVWSSLLVGSFPRCRRLQRHSAVTASSLAFRHRATSSTASVHEGMEGVEMVENSFCVSTDERYDEEKELLWEQMSMSEVCIKRKMFPALRNSMQPFVSVFLVRAVTYFFSQYHQFTYGVNRQCLVTWAASTPALFGSL